MSALSRDLNVYCEPAEFLPPGDREPFEPVAFFGSLRPGQSPAAETPMRWGDAAARPALRVYVSFGTVIWRFYEREALEALDALAGAVAQVKGAAAVISLGGAGPVDRASRAA